MVYILAFGKDKLTYESVFSELKKAEPRLNPHYVMVDFELAAIKAVNLIFPEADVSGCFFHFCQCIYRPIQSNGLQITYATDVEFAQNTRCLAALAFVPPEDVCKRYNELGNFDFFQRKNQWQNSC